MQHSIQHQIKSGVIWSLGEGSRVSNNSHTAIATGYDSLDSWLNGGWPQGAVIELHVDRLGVGELQLLMPTLKQLDQWVFWFNTPWLPYQEGLSSRPHANWLFSHPNHQKDSLWAMEECIKSGACSAVVAWLPNIHSAHVRRLQIACSQTNTLCFLFLQEQQHIATPCHLRLHLTGLDHHQLNVRCLKHRGHNPKSDLLLPIRSLTGQLANQYQPDQIKLQ